MLFTIIFFCLFLCMHSFGKTTTGNCFSNRIVLIIKKLVSLTKRISLNSILHKLGASTGKRIILIFIQMFRMIGQVLIVDIEKNCKKQEILLWSFSIACRLVRGSHAVMRHTTQTSRNKHEKLKGKGEARFDIPFMIQSHAESMKKIMRALQNLPANQHSQSSPIHSIMAGLAMLLSWQIIKASHDFLHVFSMALQHKWDVKTGFSFALQFFILISDGLGGVIH